MIEKAHVSFRIGVSLWLPDVRFEELLAFLAKEPGLTDELAFFTSETHPPLPLETLKARLDVLARRMERSRGLGYRAGVNVLSTIGHHEENLPHSLSGDFTRIMAIDGAICRGSFCPNDERMREYVRTLYELVTEARPDFIWIDDDVRLAWHPPAGYGCFCDGCLRVFARECGTSFTREELRRRFDEGREREKIDARREWLTHNRATIGRLLALIEGTVRAKRPDLPLGFMCGERFFEGYDFDGWAGILSGSRRVEVRWRPGGGFYSDERPRDLVSKSHECGRQVSLLPPQVRCIQSEIENFPYQRLKKAERTTALEAASHIAAGCTGAAFNVLTMQNEPLEEYRGLVATLAHRRPFLDLLARTFQREPPRGIWCAWNKDSFVTHNLGRGEWFGVGSASLSLAHVEELLEIGLPVAYGADTAIVTALGGDAVMAFDDAALRRTLSGGVYMDAQALLHLHERGLGELAGFTVKGFKDEDCIEELTSHPLNGAWAGRKRDARQSFWRNPAGILEPALPRAQPVARLVDYAGEEVAACAMGVMENGLGGRICVSGYCPWTFLQNLSKSSQMKSIVRWLSRDAVPAYVESFHKVCLWVRAREEGGLSVALLNMSADGTQELTLLVRAASDELQVYDMDCREAAVSRTGSEGPYRRFELPTVGPWEMRLVLA